MLKVKELTTNWKRLVPLILLFAFTGVFLLIAVRAATDKVVVQPESNVLTVDDDTAYDGDAIMFTTQDANPLPAPTPSPTPNPGTLINSPEEVAYDMFGPARGTSDTQWTGGATGWGRPWPNHELIIDNDGAQFKWLTGGWASKWNKPGSEKAIYARCKAVPANGGIGESNFKLQIRGLRSYERIAGTWSLHQGSDSYGLNGDWYDLADFLGAGNLAELKPVAGQPNVYEVAWPKGGEIFHFFMGTKGLSNGPRKLFNSKYNQNTDAFFATGQMRLVPNTNPNVDLSKVRLMGNCGLDFYKNESSTRVRDYPGRPVPSSGHPRSKVVTEKWQAFNWYVTPSVPKQNGETRTWQQLRQEIIADPPPIDQ